MRSWRRNIRLKSCGKNESIERSYKFANKKFGKNGYAINKSYVENLKYKKFFTNRFK